MLPHLRHVMLDILVSTLISGHHHLTLLGLTMLCRGLRNGYRYFSHVNLKNSD